MVQDISGSDFETVVVTSQENDANKQTKSKATDQASSNSNKFGKPLSRLLLASSRARNVALFSSSLATEVKLVTFKYETSTLDSILAQIGTTIENKKMESVGLVLHGTESQLNLCGPGEKVLNTHTVHEDVSIREFFKALTERFVERTRLNARLDFLAAHTAHSHDGPVIAAALQSLLEMPVSMSVDLQGTDVKVIRWKGEGSSKVTLGELYFDQKKLKDGAKMAGPAAKTRKKDLENYEMIRTVGKGAFGTAILFRRKDDDSLVIIKEINMLELSAAERQMSLNEVNVLAMLDHPNVVKYLDSFELDTKLCIEMEYCDGGSLAQFLTQRDRRLEEKDILVIFHQICNAIRNMHEHQILHRDLKTANIFLTKQGVVRVGDFGISKMLSTRQAHANTVLGTPYYISPEMCEGKQYDEKSDIWALGCILYEMACLQKTFEGSNLPALVNKIMKGQFAPIKGNYSPGFRQLVRDLLQRDPEFRPTAAEIVGDRIPELLAQFSVENMGADEMDEELQLSVAAAKQQAKSRPLRSVVYHMKVYTSSINLTPVSLPPRTRVKEISVSNTHVIVLTAECLVYTWGEGRRGQLGHGSAEVWRGTPAVVEALRGKTMTRVVAGDGFSVFASDNGIIMTCGDGTSGCLGHGDWNSSAKPTLVEKLLSVDVAGLACGTNHVVVVGAEGDVHSWGKGEGGRLGHGNEEDCCIPTEVDLIEDIHITNVRCGGDGTILVSDQGIMYACGNNTDNKLGLSETGGLFSVRGKKDVDQSLVPTKVKSLECRAVDVSMGPHHTAVLKETGQVVTFGRNAEGQLGKGNCKPTQQPVNVREMHDKIITMVQCGSTFTVVGTLENAIYLWGTRSVLPSSRPTTQDGFAMSVASRRGTPGSAPFINKDPDFNFSGTNSSRSLSSGLSKGEEKSLKLKDVLLQPQEILALYASPSQIAKGETVNLASIHCQNQSVFVVVDTTAPLPRTARSNAEKNISKTEIKEAPSNPSSVKNKQETKKENKLPEKELESIGPVPDWLQQELHDAEIVWSGSKPDTRPVNNRPQTTPSQLPSTVNNRDVPRPRIISDGGRQRSRSGSTDDNQSLPQSPFTPSSPEDDGPRRYSKGSGKNVPVKKATRAEEMRLRKLNRELILKEQKLKSEVNTLAKEKEASLNDEIERLRTELIKNTNPEENKKQERVDSTTCGVM